MNVTALAVIVDSAVTLGVGYWLNRTARTQVKNAVDDIGPAIQQELQNVAQEYARQAKQEIALSIQKLVPVILKAMKNASRTNANRDREREPITKPIFPSEHGDGTDTN